ncbi:MAG: TolC family protein, partial [Candidatus Dadabacteria bacterium]|nr:TolC family protein [Candidatus Dadabacteria bacterium]
MKRCSLLFVGIVICGVCWGFPPQSHGSDDIPLFDKNAFIASASYTTELRIAMVDCVAMALKSNSDILVKKISPLIEEANVLTQRGRFDPQLYFDGSVNENFDISDRPLFSPSPSKTRTGLFNFGVEQKWTTGTTTTIELLNSRLTSNADRRVQSFNPAYDSEAQVVVMQPLLKGAGIIVNKADYLIAKNNKKKSDQQLKSDVIRVITDVKKAYYAYHYANDQYAVAKTSLKRVEDLHSINKERYAKGLASDIDVIESESEVARFESALLSSENLVQSTEDELRYITNLVDDPKYWNARISLLDAVTCDKKEFDLVKCILTAFDHRPDYEAAKLDLKNRDLSVVYYRNGT